VRSPTILRCSVVVVGAHFLSGFLVWPIWAAIRPLAFLMPRGLIFPTEVVSPWALLPAIAAGAIAGIVAALSLDRVAGRGWALAMGAFVALMAALSFRWGHPNLPPPEIMIPWGLKVVLSGAVAAGAFLLTRKWAVAIAPEPPGVPPRRAPNMALQRTRRPRIRSGRSLRSLGLPLSRQPLGRRNT
jgi:hypothetical protein